MDFNIVISCAVLFIVVAIVWGVAKFILKLTAKIISIIIIATILIMAFIYYYYNVL